MKVLMKTKRNIIKGDQVLVITGDDKGQIGEVLEVHKTKNLVKVSNVRVQTHFDKKDGVSSGGINKREGWIEMSNVSHICDDNKATKVTRIRSETGVKIVSSRTKQELRVHKKKTSKVKLEGAAEKADKEKEQKAQFQAAEKKDTSFHTTGKKNDLKNKKGDK